MATIIQRVVANNASVEAGGNLLISDEEKAQLLGEIDKLNNKENK